MTEPLSPRERAVLQGIATGRTNREISQELGLALATVKRYITSLYGKLQITSRTEAIQRAGRGMMEDGSSTWSLSDRYGTGPPD
jgi:DNA-binding NarL/FixJ family response regulator